MNALMDVLSGKTPYLDADVKDYMRQTKNIEAGEETAKKVDGVV